MALASTEITVEVGTFEQTTFAKSYLLWGDRLFQKIWLNNMSTFLKDASNKEKEKNIDKFGFKVVKGFLRTMGLQGTIKWTTIFSLPNTLIYFPLYNIFYLLIFIIFLHIVGRTYCTFNYYYIYWSPIVLGATYKELTI